jgi:hypothetical protein
MNKGGMEYAAFFILTSAFVLFAQVMDVFVCAECIVDDSDHEVSHKSCDEGYGKLGQQQPADCCRAYSL